MGPTVERVYVIAHWWDRPLEGVADYRGTPHWFDRIFDEELDDYTERFALTPLSSAELELELESYAIFERWRAANSRGEAGIDSHPALPGERARYAEIERTLARAQRTPTLQVEGRFVGCRGARLGCEGVSW